MIVSLSIVIPTKNEEETLPPLLASIRAQTVQPKEIIVADARSTDKTKEIAESFGARVVDGGMPAVGRNIGAAHASGEWILFLDADVELSDPYFIERAMREASERALDLATCDVVPLSSARVDKFMHEAYNKYARAWGSVLPHAPGFCMLVKRVAHEMLGGFDETIVFCEDHDYARRLARVGSFGILKSTSISVSIRRLDRDGRLNIPIKFLLAELHLVFRGPIRKNTFNYTFGHKKTIAKRKVR